MRSAFLSILLIALPAFAQPSPEGDETQERLETLEADIDELVNVQESLLKKSKGDRLAWSAAYRIAFNNVFRTKDDETKGFPGIWNHRLRLNLEGKKGPLRLHARLSMYKNFGESYEGPLPLYGSRSTRYPRDTTLRIERLYIDWFLHRRVAISLGRVASPGGPPAELKENTSRQATWGLQMVEAEFETLLVTFDLQDTLPDTTLRFFYSPFFHHATLDPSNDETLFTDNGINVTHIWGFFFESLFSSLGDGMLAQLGFVHVPKFRPPFPTSETSETPDSLGQYYMFNALLEAKGLAKVLDLFIAGSVTLYSPNGKKVNEQLGGLASYDDDENHLAWMAYAGGRYQLPFGKELAPKMGLEINYGSKYHSHWGAPSETLINKLATRGLAIEAYWIQPIVDGFFARLGAIHTQRKWLGSFVGPSMPDKAKITNLYFLMNASF